MPCTPLGLPALILRESHRAGSCLPRAADGSLGPALQAALLVDGQTVGYSKNLERPVTATFAGFLKAGGEPHGRAALRGVAALHARLPAEARASSNMGPHVIFVDGRSCLAVWHCWASITRSMNAS